MKKFDSLLEAVREVKELTQDLSDSESIFLAIDYWGNTYYVAEDDFDISETIVKDFYENCCDTTPERVADEWKVIEYVNSLRKEKYPYSYEKSNKAKFKNGTDIIRRFRQITPEYNVEFNIS